ncbi:hypothetical protein FRB90_007471, partial [Tulasnella sp. 427]
MITSPSEKPGLPTYSESQNMTAPPNQLERSLEVEGEDDHRPLPAGWIRQWDGANQAYFYVDTTINPPLSVWEHPSHPVEAQGPEPTLSSQFTKKEQITTNEDYNMSAVAPNQQTPFLMPPVRRKQCHGPIGLLFKLLFNRHPTRTPHNGSSSMGGVYAPPAYPMSHCAQKRAERMARRMERKEQYRG